MFFKKLKLLNFAAGTHIDLKPDGQVLIIKTCQRIMLIGISDSIYQYKNLPDCSDFLTGEGAYQFLLETICGLKSKILAEYEIVSQFKKELQNFLKEKNRDSRIIKIMEKIFKDSKEIRTNHLQGICQLSYSGISRKILLKFCQSTSEKETVIITGTGKLAEDLIKLLYKKFNLIVIGRNIDRLDELSNIYNVQILNLSQISTLKKFPYIINTIGAEVILFDENFFEPWLKNQISNNLFIDLGSPSSIKTALTPKQGVYHLEDIFQETSRLTLDNLDKINGAMVDIKILVSKRASFSPRKVLIYT